jgi:hypothetical protein
MAAMRIAERTVRVRDGATADVGRISRIARAANAWLFAAESPRRLAVVRIGLCAVLAERMARPLYLQLADQPRSLFRPVSFMHLLNGMPGREAVLALQVVGISAAVLAAVGLRARAALPIAWICAVMLNGMATSAGKVVHNDILPILALVPMLMAPVSDAWSLDAVLARRRGRATAPTTSVAYGWPVRTAIAMVASAYFVIGAAKLVMSGPGWVTGSNLRWVLYASSDAHRIPNGVALFVADRPVLAHVVAGLTLAVELGFPLALFVSRLRPALVAGAVALHVGIMVAMGLDYTPWIATDLVLFVDWPRVIDRLRGRSAARGAAA